MANGYEVAGYICLVLLVLCILCQCYSLVAVSASVPLECLQKKSDSMEALRQEMIEKNLPFCNCSQSHSQPESLNL